MKRLCIFCGNQVAVGPATLLVSIVLLSDGNFQVQTEPNRKIAHDSCIERHEKRELPSAQLLSIPCVSE